MIPALLAACIASGCFAPAAVADSSASSSFSSTAAPPGATCELSSVSIDALVGWHLYQGRQWGQFPAHVRRHLSGSTFEGELPLCVVRGRLSVDVVPRLQTWSSHFFESAGGFGYFIGLTSTSFAVGPRVSLSYGRLEAYGGFDAGFQASSLESLQASSSQTSVSYSGSAGASVELVPHFRLTGQARLATAITNFPLFAGEMDLGGWSYLAGLEFRVPVGH